MDNTFKNLVALLTSAAIAFFAPVSYLIVPILWLIVIDILTALYYVRIVQKSPLTSRGFFKKLPQFSMFLVAVVAALHANPFFVAVGLPEYQAVKLVISFYGLYELFSILENLGKMGLPIAKQLLRILSAKLPDELKNELNPPAADIKGNQTSKPEQT